MLFMDGKAWPFFVSESGKWLPVLFHQPIVRKFEDTLHQIESDI